MRRALSGIAALVAVVALSACGQDTANTTLQRLSDAPRGNSAQACGGAAPFLTSAACADENVTRLSGAMDGALEKVQTALSRTGRQVLIDGQAQWLTGMRVTCMLNADDKELSAEQSVCVQLSMIDRMIALPTSVGSAGPYLFQRVESFRALPPPKSLTDKAALISAVSYPRIDNPDANGAAFNVAAFRAIRKDLPDDTEQTIVYQIYLADPKMISLEYDTLLATRGAAHQDHGVETLTFLMQEKRPLAATDLFPATDAWRKDFLALAGAKLKDAVIEQGCDAPLALEYARDASLRADRWLISAEGLSIVYPPYALGPYAMDGCKITMGWKELAPMLRPEAPVPVTPAQKQPPVAAG